MNKERDPKYYFDVLDKVRPKCKGGLQNAQ